MLLPIVAALSFVCISIIILLKVDYSLIVVFFIITLLAFGIYKLSVSNEEVRKENEKAKENREELIIHKIQEVTDSNDVEIKSNYKNREYIIKADDEFYRVIADEEFLEYKLTDVLELKEE